MGTERIGVLSIGEMDDRMQQALQARFDIHRIENLHPGTNQAQIFAKIRAIASRGQAQVTAELMACLPRLELIAHFGVGYESIDIASAVRRGVVITNTPDVLNDEMADFAVALLLATIRGLPQADRHVRSGQWASGEKFPLSASLRNRTIGIAGLGRIGRTVARRLEGFDLPLSYFGRHPEADVPYRYFGSLLEMADAVDTLIITLPGGEETRKIIDADVLRALGPDGVLINVARGSVIDEAALVQALQDRSILAAGLDVFENEPIVSSKLLSMNQVVLLPHIGTATHYTRERMGDLVVENLLSWFWGEGPITPVKETPIPRAITRNSRDG